MEIKGGYNDQPLVISFEPNKERRTAGLWLKQEGLQVPPEYQKYKETLSYLTLDELLDLKDEISAAIKQITD
jgi:hypothetical protein